jgi:WD40 repeat protein
LQEQTAAELDARLARSRGLAAAAIANLETDPELSVLLAIEAVETTKSDDGTVLPEAEIALHAALSRNRLVATLPTQFYTRSVTFSPDAATLYVGGFVESQVAPIPLLDPATIHDSYATAVSVVAGLNDEFLLVGDFDGGLFALDRETLEEVFSLDGHDDWITDMAVSADGTWVATISGLDGKAFVWDLVERRPIRQFALDCGEGADCTVGITLSEAKGVALSPDGALLGFADTVWNVEDGSPVSVPWEQPGGAILEFLPDGERVVVAEGSAVRIVDLATGATLDALYAHTSEITRVAVSHDGSRLATAARDGLIHIWELRAAGAGRILTLAGHTGPAWDVAFSPDGRYLATAGGLQDFSLGDWSLGPPYVWEARVWDLAPAAGHEWMGASLDSPIAAFHPDGTLLLASTDDGLSVWDPGTGAVVHDFALPIGAKAEVLATSPDGDLIAVGGSGQPGRDGHRGWLTLYDYATGEPSHELIAAGAGPVPTDVSFAPDGTLLAAVTEAEIRVWETASGETTFHHDNSEVRPQYAAVGFSPDGSLLATLAVTGEDPFMYPGGTIWDLASGEPRTFIGLFARRDRGDVAFSPTQPLLVTAGLGRPNISEAYTGIELGTLRAPVSYAGAAAFSPDGTLIATGEADGTVRLWDASTARQTLTLIGHGSEVVSVTFSNDGTRLASVDLDGTLRVWALDIDDLLAIAQNRVTRDLTDDEGAAYLQETRPAAGETEPILPADYQRTVPPGVTDEAWAAAPSGGTWEQAAAEGFSGDILAYDEQSRLLLVQGEEGFSVLDPVTGQSQDAADIPLLEIGEGELLPRDTAAAVYDPYNDQIVVYTAERGGVLAYDAAADRWTVLATVEDLLSEGDLEPDQQGIVHGPFGDYEQRMVYDAESEGIVLFGGATWGRFNFGNHVGLSQTWLYDPAANTWERIDPEIAPPGRVGHAMAYDVQSDRIILFGGSPGFAVDGDLLADTWAFDADTGTWTEMSPAIPPPAREGAVMWYDPTVDLVFLFGGAEGGLPWEVFGGEELWAYDYDSDTWTLYRADPNPGYRTNFSVFFDAEADAARFYGGDWYDIERRFQGSIPDMWTYRHTPAGS